MFIKALIIDDDKGDRILLSEYLKTIDLQFKILHASTAEEGISIAVDQNPDLILLDIMLPFLDGFQTCKQLKSDPRFQGKIIMLTGHLALYDKDKAIIAGADGYCVKLAAPLLEEVLKNIDFNTRKDESCIKS